MELGLADLQPALPVLDLVVNLRGELRCVVAEAGIQQGGCPASDCDLPQAHLQSCDDALRLTAFDLPLFCLYLFGIHCSTPFVKL